MAQEPGEFERHVLPHLDAAYDLARWLMRDPVAADDVVQEAMLRAWRFHAGRRGEPKPWLLRIVRNAAYAALSAMRQRAELPDDQLLRSIDPGPNPEAELDRRQDGERLTAALAALPDELRECLVLKELEEMSYKEIAHITGVPIGTVMSRLWRARQLLMGGQR